MHIIYVYACVCVQSQDAVFDFSFATELPTVAELAQKEDAPFSTRMK